MAETSNTEANNETELTMCDVLKEEQELEEDANAVLGGSDDTNCSYDQGYVPRQALYACSTCSKDSEPAGICLACCLTCHDSHEVVELYTKRHFRCDCGNSKFPDKKCNLKPDKEPINSANKYNQNFRGLYCSCSRPYPDLDDSTPDEMIQCIVCEDWYHGRHIGEKVPDNEDYCEMVCANCMKSHSFLYAYLNHLCYAKINVTDVEGDVKGLQKETEGKEKACEADSTTDSTIKVENGSNSSDKGCSNESNLDVKLEPVENGIGSISGNAASVQNCLNIKESNSEPSSLCQDETKSNEIKCILKTVNEGDFVKKSGPAFWPENWRKELCSCSGCMDMYKKNDCVFLLNVDDTILAYEERGKGSGSESQYDKGLSALGQLDRVKQMEAIRAYTNMKGKLKEYLKEFADNKRTVCESDIKEFFEQMSKRQRLNSGIPHFCR